MTVVHAVLGAAQGGAALAMSIACTSHMQLSWRQCSREAAELAPKHWQHAARQPAVVHTALQCDDESAISSTSATVVLTGMEMNLPVTYHL